MAAQIAQRGSVIHREIGMAGIMGKPGLIPRQTVCQPIGIAHQLRLQQQRAAILRAECQCPVGRGKRFEMFSAAIAQPRRLYPHCRIIRLQRKRPVKHLSGAPQFACDHRTARRAE